MRCHGVLTYSGPSHDTPFYILAEDDHALLHALEVIKNSKDVTFFEVDGMRDGYDFYDEVFDRIHPGLRSSKPKVNENE